jgi:lipopolysaccharide export system protein LptA
MPMKFLARFLLPCAVCLAGIVMPAWALQADRNQPIHIEADAMRYDDVHQTSVFSGNVVVTKGTLVLRAGTVTVRQSPDGYQYATATAAPGRLATFSQQLDTPAGQPQQTLEGEAQRIEYDGKTDVITLRGKAVLSRLIDGKLADRTQGSVISYNQITDVFTVEGGAGGVTATNPSGRVRMMLSPQPAPAKAASAASVPAAPPALKVSPRIGAPR